VTDLLDRPAIRRPILKLGRNLAVQVVLPGRIPRSIRMTTS
jgi:hypothetical protein